MFDKPSHKRHRDFEIFDEITMRVVPRYKTSGMSGDEWRTSVVVELRFKGATIITRSFSTMDTAIRHLGTFTDQDMVPDGVIDLEKTGCDQPGCPNLAESRYVLKELFSRSGHKLDPSDTHFKYYRKFCKKHLRRGDGGREDSDRNYDVTDSPGPDGSTNKEESPAVFGGVIELKKRGD